MEAGVRAAAAAAWLRLLKNKRKLRVTSERERGEGEAGRSSARLPAAGSLSCTARARTHGRELGAPPTPHTHTLVPPPLP